MKDKNKNANRIPHQTLGDDDSIKSWSIPTVGSGKKSRLVFSAKREQEQKEGSEVVEDYKGVVKPKPLTAEELQVMAEEVKKEGFDQGYKEGFVKGNVEGFEKGEKTGQTQAYKEMKSRLDDEASRMNHISSNLLVPMQEQEQAMENIVVDMAIHFAQELMQKEISQSPDVLVSLVKRAINALPAGSKNITVYVNQSDADLIDAYLPPAQRNWAISIDKALTPGGCRVETFESIVDYTVEHRLQAFIQHVRDQGDVDATTVDRVPDYEEECQTPSVEEPVMPRGTEGSEEAMVSEPIEPDARESDPVETDSSAKAGPEDDDEPSE